MEGLSQAADRVTQQLAHSEPDYVGAAENARHHRPLDTRVAFQDFRNAVVSELELKTESVAKSKLSTGGQRVLNQVVPQFSPAVKGNTGPYTLPQTGHGERELQTSKRIHRVLGARKVLHH